MTRVSDSQEKKRNYRAEDFAVPDELKVKLKESKKRDKCLDLVWELKKIWKMKVTGMPLVLVRSVSH